MTSPYYLAGKDRVPTPVVRARPMIPRLVLESIDGTVRIPLDGTQGFIRKPGATGLGMAPKEIISQAVPGVAGSNFADSRTGQRPIFLPIYVGADGDMIKFRDMMRKLNSLCDPDGKTSFYLVCERENGPRELVVTYVSGLEGDDALGTAGLSWANIPLNLLAHDPYPRSRVEQKLEFLPPTTFVPFLGVEGGTDAPWPRSLSASSVIGLGMELTVVSEMPVYVRAEIDGPVDSLSAELSPVVVRPDGTEYVITDHAWSIEMPNGVPAGKTFVMNTDPRSRTYRLDGALASERVALGSQLRPFYPGKNTLNMVAPGVAETTRIRFFYYERYRSMEAS